MKETNVDSGGFKWHMIRIQSGKELSYANALKDAIPSASKKDGINYAEFFKDFSTPEIASFEYQRGKKVEKKVSAFPGYLFINMDATPIAVLFLKNVLKTSKMMGSMTDMEYENMIAKISQKSELSSNSTFTISQKVKIMSGSFAGLEGKVESIDINKNEATIIVPIFGFDTKIEMKFEDLIIV